MENEDAKKEQDVIKSLSNILYLYKYKNAIDYLSCHAQIESALKSYFDDSKVDFHFTINDNLIVSISRDMKDSGIFDYLFLVKPIINLPQIKLEVIQIDFQWNIASRTFISY